MPIVHALVALDVGDEKRQHAAGMIEMRKTALGVVVLAIRPSEHVTHHGAGQARPFETVPVRPVASGVFLGPEREHVADTEDEFRRNKLDAGFSFIELRWLGLRFSLA